MALVPKSIFDGEMMLPRRFNASGPARDFARFYVLKLRDCFAGLMDLVARSNSVTSTSGADPGRW
jgi:hypothetical protein